MPTCRSASIGGRLGVAAIEAAAGKTGQQRRLHPAHGLAFLVQPIVEAGLLEDEIL